MSRVRTTWRPAAGICLLSAALLLASAAQPAAATPLSAGLQAHAAQQTDAMPRVSSDVATIVPAAPPLEYDGAIATGLALRRLGNTARVLHIAAHPDDENTALFAPLALGRGADIAYLSLTRGEGGQNGIGPELGTGLGLIRSEELLAARRIDGAAQFFTRAVDFGFSKHAEETFRHWPRDALLADVVEVIRRYRPDVVVSVWSGTRRDGHGQHEASGLVAREAVLAAADPGRFPEQIADGLRPHEVTHYYWSARFGDDGPDVELNTGELDPLLGRSYHQIAMASRSRHRSQDMGVPQTPGPRRTQFDRIDPADPPQVSTSGAGPGRQLEGAPRGARSLLGGVDTLLSQRAESAGYGAALEPLRQYEELAGRARAEFDPYAPEGLVPLLMGARSALDVAAGSLAAPDAPLDLRLHLAAERRDVDAALVRALNLEVDVVSDDDLVVPGQTFELEMSAWNGGTTTVAVRMTPRLPPGWTATPADSLAEAVEVRPGRRVVTRWRVDVPLGAAPTRPYFLAADRGARDRGADRATRDRGAGRDSARAALYDWPDDRVLHGLPFAPAPVRGDFAVDLLSVPATPVRGGAAGARGGDPGAAPEPPAPPESREPPDDVIHLTREAVRIGLDPREGEYRRPVRVVPRLSVRLEQDMVILRRGGVDDFWVAATLRNDAPDTARVQFLPAVPDGWTATPERIDITLASHGDERTIRFRVTPPPEPAAGEHFVGAMLQADRPGCGDESPCAAPPLWFTEGYEVIDYPHIEPRHLYRPAVSRVRALDVQVADVHVGYVAGVPDGVPEALTQLGVRWEELGEAALADGDLSRFDVIVTGTRAYEVRPDLVANNDRLLDWARDGGTLVVQYNKYPALEGSYAPWPVTIARPHGRVTDETAPVDVLEPDHPILDTPNPIGPDDWQGWVQERGLYFWESWEGPLRPLLAMSDPGEEPLEGALLAGPLGDGTYVYSALALFRQLPEGVPGAWRLFANLISLGADSGGAPAP